MAETSYFRSPSRKELRERKMDRRDQRRSVTDILHTLDSLMSPHSSGGVYSEPDVKLVTDIPESYLPKEHKKSKKTAAAESVVARSTTNPSYEADLKSRDPPPPPKRPIVPTDKPLPLSWDVSTGARNDTTKVQSKLGYSKGAGEAPEVYKPGEGNPRRALEAKRKAREVQKVQPHERRAAFEYKPKVTKLAANEVPRVVDLVPSAADASAERKRPESSGGMHGKPFRA